MTGLTQAFGEAHDLFERGAHRDKIADLAADMYINANNPDAGQGGGFSIEVFRIAPRHAELVAFLAGRDIRMTAGRDIRIDPDGHRRFCAGHAGNL